MTSDSPNVTVFVDAWLPEFARSVEMFTGAGVTPIAAPSVPPEGSDADAPRVWHEQTFDRGERGSAWIGIAQSSVSLLTGAVAADETGQFALVHELLTQSMKGAAMCLGTGDYPGIRCADTFTTEPPPDSALVSTAWFAASGGQPLAVYVYVSRELHELLGALPAGGSSEPPRLLLAGPRVWVRSTALPASRFP